MATVTGYDTKTAAFQRQAEEDFSLFEPTAGVESPLATRDLHRKDNQQDEPQTSPLEDRINCCLGLVAAGGAISLVALQAIKQYGIAFNAVISTSAGFLAFFPSVMVLSRTNKDVVKDTLTDFGPMFGYFTITQIGLNFATTMSGELAYFGAINGIFGATLAAQLHNLYHWKPEDDHVGASTIQESLLEIEDKTKSGNYSHASRIPMCLTGRAICRLVTDTVAGGLGLGAIFSDRFVPSPYSSVLPNLGQIVLGCAMGSALHEVVHYISRKYEQKYRDVEPPPCCLNFWRGVGKVEVAAALLFSGMIGFSTVPTNIGAAILCGMYYKICSIRFTHVPKSQLYELHRGQDRFFTARCKVMTNLFWFACLWIPFGIWQADIGDISAKAALGTFTGAGAVSYLLGRVWDRYDIHNSTSAFKNFGFFWTYYFNPPPIAFTAITQAMNIGSSSLEDYPEVEAALACFAWADLGRAMGAHAARSGSRRNWRYPANIDSLFTLFVYFFAQQLNVKS